MAIGILVGIVGAFVLRALFSTISSEWPRNYFAAKTSLEAHSRTNLVRYGLLRAVPVFVLSVAVAVGAESLDGSPAWAVAALTVSHLLTSTGRAVRNLWRHERGALTLLVGIYHFASSAVVVLSSVAALFIYPKVRFLVPTGKDAVNAIWTAALAALLAAGIQKAMTFDDREGGDQLRRAKRDVGAQNLAYCDEAALSSQTDPDLLRAVILAESIQRPRWMRRIENFAGRLGGSGTYGVAQMQADAPIGDHASIDLLAQSLQGLRPVVSYGQVQRLRTRTVLKRHNANEWFLDTAMDFYDSLIPRAEWASEAKAPDGRAVIEVVEVTADDQELVVRGTASVYEGTLLVEVDGGSDQVVSIQPGAPGRGSFALPIPLDARMVRLHEDDMSEHEGGSGSKRSLVLDLQRD